MKTKKKWLFSILFGIVTALGLVPGMALTAYADELVTNTTITSLVLNDSFETAATVTSGGTTTNYADFAAAVSAWNNAASGATLTLLADVTTANTINVSGTKILDLNGYGIKRTGSGRVLMVTNGANMTLHDSNATRTDTGANRPDGVSGGYITGGNTTNESGSCVRVENGSVFNMYGGSITGNSMKNGGGAVLVKGGSFNMYGGSITGNTTDNNCGGVWVHSSAGSTFNMYCGAITNNTPYDVNAEGVMTTSSNATIGNFDYSEYVAVTFDANGGTGSMPLQKVRKNTDTTIFANVNCSASGISDPAFSREGYDFAGWNTQADGEGTNYTAGTSTIKISEATTLYANWRAMPATAPTISAQPQDLSLAYGYAEGSLSVTAVAAADATYNDLSYQWYSNTTASNEGGTAIGENGTSATYAIPAGKGVGTTEYYYCVITATRSDNSQTATATSNAVTVTVNKADNPLAYAESQTVTKNYSASAQTETLAAASDGQGTVTYAITSQKNASGDVEFFTLDGTTLNLAAGTPVGSYTVIVQASAAGSNDYNSGTKDSTVTVTVNKADNPASITNAATVMEGGNTVDLAGNVTLNDATGDVSYTISIEANGCSLNGSVLTSGDTTGSAIVYVTVAEDKSYNALDAIPITVTITNKNTQTISADDVNATYGDTDASVGATTDGDGEIGYAVKDGSGDCIDVDASTGALTIKAVPTDGKAYVTVTAGETATYAQATKDVTVTISKADASAATVTANNRIGDGTEKPLVTVAGETSGGEMHYALGADATTAPAGGWTTSIPTATDGGTYYVWYKVVGDSNHNNSEPSCVTVAIDLPAPSASSELALGDGAPNVTVGGLDALAEAYRADGNTVIVTMSVEAKAKEQAAGSTEIENAAAGMRLEFLEISLTKTVDGTGSQLTETGDSVLEIIVPYDFSKKMQTKVMVYRYHNGSVTALTENTTKADGTYQLDKENNRIYIYASRFSTYAIGFTPTYTVFGTLDFGKYTGEVSFSLKGNGVSKTAISNVTNGEGSYSFTGIPAGTYDVIARWSEDGKTHTLAFSATAPKNTLTQAA